MSDADTGAPPDAAVPSGLAAAISAVVHSLARDLCRLNKEDPDAMTDGWEGTEEEGRPVRVPMWATRIVQAQTLIIGFIHAQRLPPEALGMMSLQAAASAAAAPPPGGGAPA